MSTTVTMSLSGVALISPGLRLIQTRKTRAARLRHFEQGHSVQTQFDRDSVPLILADAQPERLANWRFDFENPWPFIVSDLIDIVIILAVIALEDWFILLSILYRQSIADETEREHLTMSREIIRSSIQSVSYTIDIPPDGQVTLRPAIRPLLLLLDTQIHRDAPQIQPWFDDVSAGVAAESMPSPLSDYGDSDSDDDEDDETVLLTPATPSVSGPPFHLRYQSQTQKEPDMPAGIPSKDVEVRQPDVWMDWVGLRP